MPGKGVENIGSVEGARAITDEPVRIVPYDRVWPERYDRDIGGALGRLPINGALMLTCPPNGACGSTIVRPPSAFFPRLVVVPRANVVAMEVGPFEDQQQAYGTGYSELRELCGQKIAEAPAGKGTPKVICGQQPGLVNLESLVHHTKKNRASGKEGHQASRKK
jgi:hypothetical protein